MVNFLPLFGWAADSICCFRQCLYLYRNADISHFPVIQCLSAPVPPSTSTGFFYCVYFSFCSSFIYLKDFSTFLFIVRHLSTTTTTFHSSIIIIYMYINKCRVYCMLRKQRGPFSNKYSNRKNKKLENLFENDWKEWIRKNHK